MKGIIVALLVLALAAAFCFFLVLWDEKHNYRFTTFANISDIGASKFGFRRFIIEYSRKGKHYIVQTVPMCSLFTAKRRKCRWWDIYSVKDKDGNTVWYARPAKRGRKDEAR